MDFEKMLTKRNYKPKKVVNTAKLTNEEWLEYRKFGLGGSDAPIVLNESEWSSPLDLYYKKVNAPVLLEVKEEIESKFRLNFGHALEAFIADFFPVIFPEKYKTFFEMRFGKKIKDVKVSKDTWMYRHPLFTFMQVNLDAVIEIFFEDGSTQRGVFECKTTSPYAIADKWSDDVPINYQLQCGHAMAVMNYDFTVIACASDNGVSHYYAHLIFRDAEKEKMIITVEKKFWENHVEKRVPPEITTVAAATYFNTLLKFNAGPVGTLKEEKKLTTGKLQFESYFDKMDKINACKEEIKALEKAAKVDVAKIFDILGKNDLAILENGDYCYHVNKYEKTSTSFDKATLKKLNPELVEDLTKVKTSTELNITKDARLSIDTAA